MRSKLLAGVLFSALFVAIVCGVEPPATREAVQAIVERSKKDPNALLELKGASLEFIMPPLRELGTMGIVISEQWENSLRAGREKEFFEMGARGNRDPKYYAEAYPMARDILMSHPSFEWTMRANLERISYILKREYADGVHDPGFAPANSDYGVDLDFANCIPEDAAIRIIGPCLTTPYYPRRTDDDVPYNSSASYARFYLAGLLKKRYGEELPKDIEAARAWWITNEHRFTAEQAVVPQNETTSIPAGHAPLDSQRDASPERETDSAPVKTTTREIRWPIPVATLSVILAILVWFFRRKR